jgi:hypothetical protein
VVLRKGHGDTGTYLDSDDDTGPSTDSLLADVFLQPGNYTIEATTTKPQATGNYTLTITVDHTPRADAQPKELDATVGAELREIWTYQPGAATAAITTPLPDGITATINAAQGLATLTVTAAHAGEYDIDITYTNGPNGSHTATTTITATCPTHHTQTPTENCNIPAHCVHSVQSLSATDWAQRWGRLSYSGNWRNACATRSAQGNKSVYFKLDISVPNPAENTLPVQFWLTTRPDSAMFLYQGHNPNTATPVNVGNMPINAVENTRVYTLPAGVYILEAGLRSQYDALGENTIQFFVQLPSPEKQYLEVKRLGATEQVAGVLTLDGFLDVGRNHQTRYPYLSWGHDGCSNVPDSWSFKLWRETAYGHWQLIETRVIPAHEGCWRHDFNYRNLSRIQERVYGGLYSWVQATKDASDNRFKTDLEGICRKHLPESEWELDREGCLDLANTYYLGVHWLAALSDADGSAPIGPTQ